MFSLDSKRLLFPALVTAVFVMSSCKNPKEDSAAESILKTEKGGDFRGVKIGDHPEVVRKTENARSVYSMPDELVYRIDPQGMDSTWYEISYNFNEQGLYDISMKVYPKNDSTMSQIKKEFIQHYIEKYGDCSYQNGYCQWRAMTENGHIVSITIADEANKHPRPSLLINFNETQQ